MSTEAVVSNGFSKFSLSEEMNKTIVKLGYETPTPVQEAVIPLLLGEKTDLIALANTGTGKTGAFGIPLVERLANEKKIQALIVCPTRELALQVAQNVQGFGSAKGLRVAAIVGGESYRKQFDMLRTSPNIVVSTPGRLIDLMEQNKIKLNDVEYFILDEADEMLSFGFKDALESIWSELEASGKDFNTWLFSATMNPSIQKLTHKYLEKPKEFFLQKAQDQTKVESFAAVVYEEDKPDALCLALLQTKDFYGIIFCQTKQQVDNLENKIRDCGFKVQSLHGDKTQAERSSTVKRLKNKEFQILVATDVAARGLDIEDLTHVVNFDLPWDHETYTHRVGRTARAGKTGIVWNFTKPKDIRQMKSLEKALKVTFKNLEIASVDQIRHQLIENWMTTMSSFHPTTNSIADIKKVNEKMALEKPMSEETELWLAKVLQFFHIGLPKNLRAPRVMDFTRLDDRGPSRGFDRGGDRPDFRRGGRGGGFGGGGDRFRGGGRPSRYGAHSEGGGRDGGGSRGGFGRRSDGPSESRATEWNSDRPARTDFAPRGDRPQRTESAGRPDFSRDRSDRSDRPVRSFSDDRRASAPERRPAGGRFDYGAAPMARPSRGGDDRPRRSRDESYTN
jgi:ATP-dependent RNA helicase DeaD